MNNYIQPTLGHRKDNRDAKVRSSVVELCPLEIVDLVMFPMQYDKFACSLPLDTISNTVPGDIYVQLETLLKSTYPGVVVKYYDNLAQVVSYYNQGEHLLSLAKTNASNSLILTMYGANSWDMSRWVLKELGDLKTTMIDVCIDYTGHLAWVVSYYKLEILAGLRAVDFNEDIMRMRSILANTPSKHKPITCYTPLNNTTRVVAYEKGRKMMNDIHAMVPDHPLIQEVDKSWVRIELQSWNLSKPLGSIPADPMIAWMDARGGQDVMDKLFYSEREVMRAGIVRPTNLAMVFKKWFPSLPEQTADMDQWLGLRMATAAEKKVMARLYADVHALKASTLA